MGPRPHGGRASRRRGPGGRNSAKKIGPSKALPATGGQPWKSESMRDWPGQPAEKIELLLARRGKPGKSSRCLGLPGSAREIALTRVLPGPTRKSNRCRLTGSPGGEKSEWERAGFFYRVKTRTPCGSWSGRGQQDRVDPDVW